jgi:hypothetical protein
VVRVDLRELVEHWTLLRDEQEMPASSRHSGAIRVAPIAKLMCSSWAARASAPVKYPAPARIATGRSPCPRRQGGQAPARGAADPARSHAGRCARFA